MAVLLLSGPRAELLARVPSSLRPSLREHSGRGRAFLLLNWIDWDEELPPSINVADCEHLQVSFARNLDEADEVIAKAWAFPDASALRASYRGAARPEPPAPKRGRRW